MLSLVFGKHEPQDALNRVRAALAEYRCGRLPLAGLLAARRARQSRRCRLCPGASPAERQHSGRHGLCRRNRRKRPKKLASAAVEHARECRREGHSRTPGRPGRRGRCGEARRGRFHRAGRTVLPAGRQARISDGSACGTFDVRAVHRGKARGGYVRSSRQRTKRLSIAPISTGSGRRRRFWRDTERAARTIRLTGIVIRHEGRDVGCLLLADYGEHGNCELTYMGLVPSARGNGWGVLVTRYAQWVTGSLERDRIVLAVDSANQPARNMYAAAGFRGWDRRQVYMLALDPPTGPVKQA